MLDDMLALAHSICLLALSRSDCRVLSLLLVWDVCAVLCLWYGSRYLMMVDGNMLVYFEVYVVRIKQDAQKTERREEGSSCKTDCKNEKSSFRRVINEGVVQVGALGGQGGANGAR